MKRLVVILLMATWLVALSACAHRELTAPCQFSTFNFGAALASDCGEARPINK